MFKQHQVQCYMLGCYTTATCLQPCSTKVYTGQVLLHCVMVNRCSRTWTLAQMKLQDLNACTGEAAEGSKTQICAQKRQQDPDLCTLEAARLTSKHKRGSKRQAHAQMGQQDPDLCAKEAATLRLMQLLQLRQICRKHSLAWCACCARPSRSSCLQSLFRRQALSTYR